MSPSSECIVIAQQVTGDLAMALGHFARATYGPGQRGVDHLIHARDIIDAEIKRRAARNSQAEKEAEDEGESITVLVYGSALPVRVAVLACAGWDTEIP